MTAGDITLQVIITSSSYTSIGRLGLVRRDITGLLVLCMLVSGFIHQRSVFVIISVKTKL